MMGNIAFPSYIMDSVKLAKHYENVCIDLLIEAF